MAAGVGAELGQGLSMARKGRREGSARRAPWETVGVRTVPPSTPWPHSPPFCKMAPGRGWTDGPGVSALRLTAARDATIISRLKLSFK